jgi:hypothetical protein
MVGKSHNKFQYGFIVTMHGMTSSMKIEIVIVPTNIRMTLTISPTILKRERRVKKVIMRKRVMIMMTTRMTMSKKKRKGKRRTKRRGQGGGRGGGRGGGLGEGRNE